MGNSVAIQQQTFTTEPSNEEQREPELYPPTPVEAEAVSSSAILVSWYDQSLGRNQAVTDDRVYTVRYRPLSGKISV